MLGFCLFWNHTAASCGTLSFGLIEWALFPMPGFLLWKKINLHLAWLSTVPICKGAYVLGKACPCWPGKVEVVLNYQETRLIMALLHCFSSVPVLGHSHFYSDSVFWYSYNHSSRTWLVKAFLIKFNWVMWKCPNHVDVAVDLEHSYKNLLRKMCHV